MAEISKRHLKAWERFNDDLQAFALESEGSKDSVVTLYEDAFTTRNVRCFEMTMSGGLTWEEDGKTEHEFVYDEDDAREWLAFWKANLRRAKKYWSMDAVELDRIQDGLIEDMED